jgi:hypothetical protein
MKGFDERFVGALDFANFSPDERASMKRNILVAAVIGALVALAVVNSDINRRLKSGDAGRLELEEALAIDGPAHKESEGGHNNDD